MAYDGSIRINTKIDTAGFSTGVNKMKQGLSTVTDKVGGLVRKMTALAGIAGLGMFAKSALDAASDLQEVQNVVDTAFGSMSNKCEDFAKSALKNFGLSEYAAKKMASTYMAMGKSMGLSMDYASDMAISVSERTADIASFYNLTAEEASTKLKSIYTGETETLKSLGVVMTEANLKQYALSQGITKSYKDMDQAEKVMLRYGYVMQATSDAAGDFARTSDSWANQTKMLSENFNALKTTLGGFLITVLTPAIKGLNSMVQVITNVITAVRTAMSDLFGIEFQEVTSSAGAAVEDVSDGMGDLAENTKEATKQQNKQNRALASFDKLNKLNAKTTSGGGSTKNKSGSGSGSGFTIPITKSNNALGEAGKKLDNITKKIKSLLSWVNKLITPLKTFMLSEKGFPRFWEITKKLADSINWSKVKKAVEDLADALTILAELTWTALMDFYEEFLVPIGTWTMNEALPKLASCLKTMAEKLKNSKLVDNLKGLWKILSKFAIDVGTGLIDFFVGLANVALDYILSLNWEAFNNAIGFLCDIIATVAKDIGKGIVNFFEGIQPVVSWLTNGFILLIEKLFQGLQWLIDKASKAGVIEQLGEACGAALFAIVSVTITLAVIKRIKDLGETVKNFAKNIGSGPKGWVILAIAALALAISKLVKASKEDYEGSWQKGVDEDIENLKQKADELKEDLKGIDDTFKGKEGEANGTAAYLHEVADEYFKLKEQSSKTATQWDRLQQLESTLRQEMPEFAEIIDDTTLTIQDQKQAVDDLIESMKEKALQEALQEKLKDTYKKQADAIIEQEEAVKKQKDAYEKLFDARKKFRKWQEKNPVYDEKTAEEYHDWVATIDKLKENYDGFTEEVDEYNQIIETCNKEIDDTSNTIKKYNTNKMQKENKDAAGTFKGVGDESDTTKERVTKNVGDMTNAVIDGTKKAGEEAAGKETKATFKKAGEDDASEFTGGFKSEIGDDKTGLANSVNTEMDSISGNADKQGKEYGKNYLKGVQDELSKSDPRFQIEDDGKGGQKVTLDVKGRYKGGIFARGSWRDLPHYANGMPAGVRGSLFIAGERGPEIVAQGRPGSSEILNASQIASAIYSAVSSAMANRNLPVNVTLRGDAGKLFEVIVDQNNKNTLITNNNALGGI